MSARVLFAALVLGLCSCGEESRVRTIDVSRTYAPVDGGFNWNAPPESRFRFSLPAGGMSPAAGGDAHGGEGGLHWTTPEGWRELPTSSMRQANFEVAGDPSTECYLTVLPGSSGGVSANINRWRKQMTLPEAAPEELAKLATVPFLDGEAVFVDLEGTFTGMSGDVAGEGFRMIGLVQVTAGSSRFLKLVGPAATVAAQLEAFFQLAASFHEDGPGAHGGDPHAGQAPQASAATGSIFTWVAPEGWEKGPDRQVREVTFFAGAAECYVTVLGGTGGGVEANINRWQEQMGAEPLTTAEVEALARIPFLGTEAYLVEVPGSYVGMGDANVPEALMLGAVCVLPQAAVFVKMVGPRDDVEPQREAFRSFCRSIELAR